jgi:hypothetical protein
MNSAASENLDLYVIINNQTVKLTNKKSYIFVDIFDFFPFDLSKVGGTELILTLNGIPAEFTSPLNMNDVIEIYWRV